MGLYLHWRYPGRRCTPWGELGAGVEQGRSEAGLGAVGQAWGGVEQLQAAGAWSRAREGTRRRRGAGLRAALCSAPPSYPDPFGGTEKNGEEDLHSVLQQSKWIREGQQW